MIETTLRTLLTSSANVLALVSAARIYPVILDQGAAVVPNTVPAITYYVASEQRESSFAGPNGLPGALICVELWADTYLGMLQLSEAVRLLLDGYAGTPAGGDRIKSCSLENKTDHFEGEVKSGLYHRLCDYRIFYDEVQA